jgi:gluconokinase
MKSTHPVLVGVDLGTSAVKVLACTIDGKTVAERAADYPLSTPRPGYVEQDAEVVYRAAMKALQDVLEEVRLRGDEAAAIGISAAMHGVLPVDAQGEPCGPLITWMDRRSASIADAWRADGTAAELYRRTGAPVHPMLPSCKLRWLAENDRDTFERAARFVSLKELLVYRWTGEWLVDWGIASATGLFNVDGRGWDGYALDEAGIDASRLSEPAPPSTALRGFRPGVATTLGLTNQSALVLASSDGALANLGVGAVAPDEVALTLGTSGAVRVVVDEPALDEGARTFCYAFDDARYIAGGPTSSAGAVLNKIHALFAPEVDATERFSLASRLAEAVPIGANGLTVLPLLSGERAPYWMADLRGAFVGLDIAHTRADVFRASFEGVVCAVASVYDVLRQRLGDARVVRLSGGLTHAPIVRQLVADIFGCTAIALDQEEASAFGAAAMAGIATGLLKDAAAVAASLTARFTHEPDPSSVDRYREVVDRYRACVAATLPLYGGSAPDDVHRAH